MCRVTPLDPYPPLTEGEGMMCAKLLRIDVARWVMRPIAGDGAAAQRKSCGVTVSSHGRMLFQEPNLRALEVA
jgi:hypothetical protein